MTYSYPQASYQLYVSLDLYIFCFVCVRACVPAVFVSNLTYFSQVLKCKHKP